MNTDLLKLVSDTLLFIKEETYRTTLAPKKTIALPAKPAAQPQPQPTPPLSSSPAPPPKKDPPSIFCKIQKHLPHLRLVQTIPAMRQVALVYFSQEDLPFFKNLKTAIEKHHCPVKLIHGEQKLSLDIFELVITQRDIGAKRQIVLASIASYQNNTEQKKILWSQICSQLLPKSS